MTSRIPSAAAAGGVPFINCRQALARIACTLTLIGLAGMIGSQCVPEEAPAAVLDGADSDMQTAALIEQWRSSGLFVPVILREVPRWELAIVCDPDGKPYGEGSSRLTQIVAQTAAKLGMAGFTLDACRHGGMTELEEAALTDGQGRALSAHQTRSAYSGYAKETRERMLAATLKRREARLAILREDEDTRPRPGKAATA